MRITPRFVAEATYVLVVSGVAARGFATESTEWILAGFALALPMGLAALPGYYLVYGFLALLPGANPDTASGTCIGSGTEETCFIDGPASWFELTTDIVGVLAVATAAVTNVALLRLITRSRRAGRAGSTGSMTPGTAPR